MALKPYEAGVPSASRLPGMHLLRRDCKLQVYNPSYKKGRTLFRPWPTILKNGEPMPWRDSEGNFGINFFVQDRVCHGWGVDCTFTCFTEASDQSNWPQGSPLEILYNDVRSNDQFKDLLESGGKNNFRPVSAPRVYGFLKGLLIENAGKKYNKAPIWGALLMMPPSLREAFDLLINTPAPPGEKKTTEDDPYGWNSKYLVGDPIGLKYGKVFEMHKESELLDMSVEKGVNVSGVAVPESGRAKSGIESYACRIWPHNNGYLELPLEKVKKWDKSFEEAFWYMTGTEQLEICIIPGFGRSCKELVLYSFGGKDILPASFEFGRSHHDMGAATQKAAPAAEPEVNVDDDGDIDVGMDDDNVSVDVSAADDEDAINLDADNNEEAMPDPSMPDPNTMPAKDTTAEGIKQRLAALKNK